MIRARVTLTSRERGGAGLRAVVGAGLVAAVALAGYGLVRYPGLRSDADAAIAAVTFVALLVAYGAVTLSLSRGTGLREVTARRYGVVGGVVIGAAWLVVLSPTECLEGMGPRPADSSRCSAPVVSPRWRRGRAGTSPPDPAPRCGAGSWAACWSSPSG